MIIPPPGLGEPWCRAMELAWVRFLEKPLDEYSHRFSTNQEIIKNIVFKYKINFLFDFIEFIISLNHPEFENLSKSINIALTEGRTAYRVIDNKFIVPVSSKELGDTLSDGIHSAQLSNWNNAENHLIDAARELRSGRWNKSVHQSMSAVEGVCRTLTGENNLKKALDKMSADGFSHKALSDAFLKLYGWTSDEEGVRHALVLKDESEVDEAAALFMLGACASFVAFVSRRSTSKH